ncbi:hypothetical protein E5CHR_03735 [Variovorax sp. PBL-E5]|nr:hypothetical protein E5CHR_03735 [Variovorax sp. PBL-E5]
MTQEFSFAAALRKVRKARGLSQEDFSSVFSRTYLSSLAPEEAGRCFTVEDLS